MKNIIDEMTTMPELIKKSELAILELKTSIAKVKEQMNVMCREVACEVAAENEGGKKTFSNAEAREAEADKRLQKNEEFQKLKDSFFDLDNQKSQEEINLQNIKDIFSVNRYKVRLYTSDKMDKASERFCDGLKIIAGLGDLITMVTNTRQDNRPNQNTGIPDDCPF